MDIGRRWFKWGQRSTTENPHDRNRSECENGKEKQTLNFVSSMSVNDGAGLSLASASLAQRNPIVISVRHAFAAIVWTAAH